MLLEELLPYVTGPALEEARHDLEQQSRSVRAHRRFLDTISIKDEDRTNDKDTTEEQDPTKLQVFRLRFLNEAIYRKLAGRSANGVVELDPKGMGMIQRVARSFYMGDEPQFANLTRVLWNTQSLSTSPKGSVLYWLNGITGTDMKRQSLEQLAQVNGFDVATYECPGQVETIAEFSVGFAAYMALATNTHPIVYLYGDKGSSRNRHNTRSDKDDRQVMYNARKQLLEALNFEVREIDIPNGFFSIPDNFAIARAMMELNYFVVEDEQTKRPYFEVDAAFIDHLRKGSGRLRSTKLYDILHSWEEQRPQGYEPKPQDYEGLTDKLKPHLVKMGTEILHQEGVYDISDIILRADGYKNPILPAEPAKLEGDGEKHEGTEKKAKVRDPVVIALKAKANVWNKLLPSELTDLTLAMCKKINSHFDDLDYSGKKRFVEYYWGETINILGPLMQNPSRALLKIGNHTEEFWDNFIFALDEDSKLPAQSKVPRMSADLLWLFGQFLPVEKGTRSMPSHAPFGSLLYSHFTQLGLFPPLNPNIETADEVLRAGKYISYGPDPSRKFLRGTPGISKGIPLISDPPRTLLEKFISLSQYNPNETARLVVGAIYCLINTGDGSPQAVRQYRANKTVLMKASRSLPQAYQRAISVLDPKEIPSITDGQIKKKYDRHFEGGQFDLIDAKDLESRIKGLEELVAREINSARERAIESIVQTIRELNPDLSRAIALAEGQLPPAYTTRYENETKKIQSDHNMLDARLYMLAGEFFQLYRLPSGKRRGKSYQGAVSLLRKAHLSEVYNIGMDKALREAHESTPVITKQVIALGDQLVRLNDRYAAIKGGAKSKGERLAGIGLGEYLEAAAGAIAHLGYYRNLLGDVLKLSPKRRATELSDVLTGSIDGISAAIDKTMDYFLNGVERIDLIGYLQTRFENVKTIVSQGKVDRTQIRPERARESLQVASINLQGEIFLLECLDRRLGEAEQSYLSEKTTYAASVLSPGELQQSASLRNAFNTWLHYLKQSVNYVAGNGIMPSAPVRTAQSESAYSISSRQAFDFFMPILKHLRKELGEDYFASQRARHRAILHPA